MSAPTTASLFIDYVRKSGIVDPVTLEQYLAENPQAENLPGQELAGRMVRDGLLTSFQATHLLRGRFKNFLIGKFKLLQPLGSGGMSHVYLCEHVTMKHRVALKLLPAKESKDPTAVSRFLREARAAATVNHPNLVRAHDFDKSEDGKYYYLIMDYVDGVNLHDLVKKIGPLPPAQAANYISQAAVGLQHILECGLIHRDLKPSNLILDRNGIVRITDLGLARFTNDASDQLTRQISSQAVIGTADYIAPEQALNSEHLDIRADIYSLGVTFYFLLSGAAPFEQQSVAQKLLSHQIREPDPIPGIAEEVQAIVSKMLQKKVEGRYQTPIEIAEALAPWTSETLPVPDENYFPGRASNSGPGTGGPRTASPISTLGTKRPQSRVVTPGTGSALHRVNPSSSSVATAPPSAVTPTTATPKPRSRKRVIALGVAVACILLAAATLIAWNPFAGPSGSGKPSAFSGADAQPRPELTLKPSLPGAPNDSLTVSPSGNFTTIAQALTQARAGSRILILGPAHSEPPLILDSLPPGITIQGWPEQEAVIWRSTSSDAPIVRIANCASLTLKNLHFEGKDDIPVLIELTGNCKSARLEQLTATGFKTAAIKVHELQGEANHPVVVNRLRAMGNGDSGVWITGTAPSRHLTLDFNRFEAGMRAGVRIQASTQDLAIRHTRFASLGGGIFIEADVSQMSLSILGNTFSECGAGLELLEVLGPTRSIQIKNNLFFKTRLTARCAAAENKILSDNEAVWIWFDDRLEKNVTSVPAGSRFFRKNFRLPGGADIADAILDIGCATSFEVQINGVAVGASEPKHFTKRVYAFPVGKYLKDGINIITVKANHTRDPINTGYATAAGLTARIGIPGKTPWVSTDGSWKVTDTPPDRAWTDQDFDDTSWSNVKIWDIPGFVLPWQGSIWDSLVSRELNLPTPVPFTVEGNVRDYISQDGFPLLNSMRGFIPTLAGTDASDDSTFLRTPRTIPRLYTIGTDSSPVGVPIGR